MTPAKQTPNQSERLQGWDLAFEQLPKALLRQEIAMKAARDLVWQWFFRPIDTTNFWEPNDSDHCDAPGPVGPPTCIRIVTAICEDLDVEFDQLGEDRAGILSSHILEIMALGITVGDEVRS
jgi:hypothetical protein